jgi:hypothetical protein
MTSLEIKYKNTEIKMLSILNKRKCFIFNLIISVIDYLLLNNKYFYTKVGIGINELGLSRNYYNLSFTTYNFLNNNIYT